VKSGAKSAGVVGLGLLGMALAERLLDRGWSVSGFDANPDRGELLAGTGGRPVESLSEIASEPLLILSLPNSDVVADVVTALKPHLQTGQTIVDTTTGRPRDVEAIGSQLAGDGVDYLDACVGVGESAGPELSRPGTATSRSCAGTAGSIRALSRTV